MTPAVDGVSRMQRRRDERAVSAVEMSIVAPVFLLLIFVIVQGALLFYGSNVATTAAREGASYMRLAVVSAEGDTGSFEAVAEETALIYAEDIGMLSGVTAEATLDDDDTATVTVTGTVIDLVPIWDLDVERSVTVQVERFRPDVGPDGEAEL